MKRQPRLNYTVSVFDMYLKGKSYVEIRNALEDGGVSINNEELVAILRYEIEKVKVSAPGDAALLIERLKGGVKKGMVKVDQEMIPFLEEMLSLFNEYAEDIMFGLQRNPSASGSSAAISLFTFMIELRQKLAVAKSGATIDVVRYIDKYHFMISKALVAAISDIVGDNTELRKKLFEEIVEKLARTRQEFFDKGIYDVQQEGILSR